MRVHVKLVADWRMGGGRGGATIGVNEGERKGDVGEEGEKVGGSTGYAGVQATADKQQKRNHSNTNNSDSNNNSKKHLYKQEKKQQQPPTECGHTFKQRENRVYYESARFSGRRSSYCVYGHCCQHDYSTVVINDQTTSTTQTKQNKKTNKKR